MAKPCVRQHSGVSSISEVLSTGVVHENKMYCESRKVRNITCVNEERCIHRTFKWELTSLFLTALAVFSKCPAQSLSVCWMSCVKSNTRSRVGYGGWMETTVRMMCILKSVFHFCSIMVSTNISQ